MPLQIRLLAAIVVSVPIVVDAQCYAHSDCPAGQYCDTSMACYSCTYVNPMLSLRPTPLPTAKWEECRRPPPLWQCTV